MKWVFGVLCLLFAAFSFGVRLHPGNAEALFQRENFDNYCEIEFFSGQKMAGKLVSENTESLELTLGFGTAVFKKNEIKSRRLLDAEAVKSGKYSGMMPRATRRDRPLMTVRYEDSVFYQAEKRLEHLFSRAAAKARKEGASLKSLSSLQSERTAESDVELEPAFPVGMGLPSAVTPSSAVRGFTSETKEEQDYAAVLKAGLDQLRNSAK